MFGFASCSCPLTIRDDLAGLGGRVVEVFASVGVPGSERIGDEAKSPAERIAASSSFLLGIGSDIDFADVDGVASARAHREAADLTTETEPAFSLSSSSVAPPRCALI